MRCTCRLESPLLADSRLIQKTSQTRLNDRLQQELTFSPTGNP